MTVPFVRAVSEVVRARGVVDARLDDAAMMLIELERRHGVSIESRGRARRPLEPSEASELVAPFLMETWLAFPGEWIAKVDVTADGRSASTSPRRWATLVAAWASEHWPRRHGWTFLDFGSLGDACAAIEDYAPFVRGALVVVEHAWTLRGSAAVGPRGAAVACGSTVTVSSSWPRAGRTTWSVRVVAEDDSDGTNAVSTATSELGRALLGARAGDVVETERYGALTVIEVR